MTPSGQGFVLYDRVEALLQCKIPKKLQQQQFRIFYNLNSDYLLHEHKTKTKHTNNKPQNKNGFVDKSQTNIYAHDFYIKTTILRFVIAIVF